MSSIFRIQFFLGDITSLVDDSLLRLKKKKSTTIATANPEILVYAKKHSWYKKMLQKMTYITCDGYGTYLSLHKKVHRITGVELLDELSNVAEREQLRVFILGTESDTIVNKGKQSLQKKFPNLDVLGSSDVLVKIKNGEGVATGSGIEQIFVEKPDIIFLALGHPKQEFVIQTYLTNASFPCISVGVGGAIDMLADPTRVAPTIFKKFGLEWLYRLIRQPQRFPRICTATIIYPYYLLKAKLYD